MSDTRNDWKWTTSIHRFFFISFLLVLYPFLDLGV